MQVRVTIAVYAGATRKSRALLRLLEQEAPPKAEKPCAERKHTQPRKRTSYQEPRDDDRVNG